MTELEKVEIMKWLWFAEVHYQNIMIQEQNFFERLRYHTLNDFIRVMQAEQRFKDFCKFASDLTILLRLDGHVS